MPSVAKTAFGKFEVAVQRTHETNRIRTAPGLIYENAVELEDFAGACPGYRNGEEDLVFICNEIASLGDVALSRGVYAHELGHILGDHPIVYTFGTYSDLRPEWPTEIPASSRSLRSKIADYATSLFRRNQRYDVRYREQEFEADRIAAILTGSKKDILEARSLLSPSSEFASHVFGGPP